MNDISWSDIDQAAGENVMVLRPDRTWKLYQGHRFKLERVEFRGTPEAIADELQALRDAVEWDDAHYCQVDVVYVEALSGGMVSLRLKLYLTNRARGYGPLRSLKMRVLEVIVKSMLLLRNSAQEGLLGALTERTAQDVQEGEDERFLRQVETAIRAYRERRSCVGDASSRDEP
jgi:hypothetical protein